MQKSGLLCEEFVREDADARDISKNTFFLVLAIHLPACGVLAPQPGTDLLDESAKS